jgi:hypothetical protein
MPCAFVILQMFAYLFFTSLFLLILRSITPSMQQIKRQYSIDDDKSRKKLTVDLNRLVQIEDLCIFST